MKVVLDTNVLVSALITRGKPRKLFDKILEKKLDHALSEEMLVELKEVLKRPKFRKYVDKKRIDRFVDLVNKNVKSVKISSDFDVTIDKGDNMILNTAYSAKAEYIVSGDEHLLKLQNFKGIKIVTPSEMLEILGEELRELKEETGK